MNETVMTAIYEKKLLAAAKYLAESDGILIQGTKIPLIKLVEEALRAAYDFGFSAGQLTSEKPDRKTEALETIAQELKRANDENENHHENLLLVLQGERFI